MTTQIQRRRGTTTEHGSFTGAVGEITIDTTKDTVVVHDGSTAGGHPLATENNPTFTGNVGIGTTSPGSMSAGANNLVVGGGSGNTGLSIFSGSGSQGSIYFADTDATLRGAIRYNHSEDSLRFFAAGGERLRIDSSGRLLLNGTTATGNNKLQVISSDASINSLTVGRGKNSVASNTALGDHALFTNTTGSANTAVGFNSLYYVSTNSNNTAVGNRALQQNTGSNNTAVGSSALLTNNVGSDNTAVGYYALLYNQSGNNNTAFGRYALAFNTTGSKNIGIGYTAGDGITTGSNNTIIGDIPGTATLSDTVIIGAGAAERLRIDSSGRLGLGTSSPDNLLHLSASNSGIGDDFTLGKNILRFEDTDITQSNNQFTGGILFEGNDGDAGAAGLQAAITCNAASTGGNGGSQFRFYTTAGGSTISGSSTPSMVIDSSGATTFIKTVNNTAELLFGYGSSSGIYAGIGGQNNFNTNQLCDLLFYTNGSTGSRSPSERMRIDSSGNVGVGNSSPAYKLSVLTTGTSDTSLHLATTGGASDNGDATNSVRFTGGTNTRWANAKYEAFTHIFNANGTERLRIDSSGRLLVGTTSAIGGIGAGARLQVKGNTSAAGAKLSLQRDQAAGSTGVGEEIGQLVFSSNDGGDYALITARTDGASSSTSDCPGRIEFSTTADGASSPTERMRIRANGSMTMGDPSSSGNGGWSVFTSDPGTSSQRGRMLFYAKSGASGVNEIIQIFTGTSEKLRIRADGNVTNANNSYGALSDAKLKENIVDANSQWNDLKAIQVRNYNFIEGQTHTQIGVVAQEVELVSPGLVTESPDRDEEDNDLGTVTKSVNYSVLYMKAVKALQEAMERIETLEQRLSDAGIA